MYIAAMLVLVPGTADAWLDNLYWYEEAGLVSDMEVEAAMQYLRDVGFLTHDQTVSYSVSGWLGMIPDEDIPLAALGDSLDAWEAANPGLRFIESDDAEIDIILTHKLLNGRAGEANCRLGIPHIDCEVIIGLGDYDCNGKFVQRDYEYVKNIITHEIGHALGLGHTNDAAHLMYGANGVPTTDWNGYVVPEKHPEWFVGQKTIYDDISDIDGVIAEHKPVMGTFDLRFASLEAELSALESDSHAMDDDLDRIRVEMTVVDGANRAAMEREYDSIESKHVWTAGQHDMKETLHDELASQHEVEAELHDSLTERRQGLLESYMCYPNVWK